MKILIASDLFNPEVNGIVTSINILYEGLKKHGHDVRIVTLSQTHSERKDGDFYYVPSINADIVYPHARLVLPGKYKIIKELIEWNPDVIHTHCELSTFCCACYIARKTNTPIVHHYHTVYKYYVRYLPLGNLWVRPIVPNIIRQISGKTKAFITPTDKMRQILEGYHIKSDIFVVPSAIRECFFDSEYFKYRNSIREKYGIKENECLLLYLGRVAKEKNIEELIDFIGDEELSGYRIMIVGDGPHRKKIEKYIQKQKVSDRVIFVGMIDPNEVPRYYVSGDIFVNASRSESQGLTYMEAMACKIPVLCRYDSCLDGVITNSVNGFMYNSRDEFKQYLRLLANDEHLRTTVAENAKTMVFEKYNQEKFVKECEKIYELKKI
ncbi:1,2-diacylglycerol 3-alpha-glucosyltransferase [Oribacterium sp. KHPX15]|uniref:glycosyltransferase n=1 Tax=Oribacterium sp. KHPX15 TaxID=1855342 RepID=UPI000896E809|nr:glycosyltransferase [Oribacterium sp. KHPX15]SEA07861.1 1,2-diacylglycerol 3-alpha-glucosyltransferase [Oribacterium sp. KHPX15]